MGHLFCPTGTRDGTKEVQSLKSSYNRDIGELGQGQKLMRSAEENRQHKADALVMLGEGSSIREVSEKLGIKKSVVSRWRIEVFGRTKAPVTRKSNKKSDIVPSAPVPLPDDGYANYIDSLRSVKSRQIKWAGAITETGIRTLKLANRLLAAAEKKDSFTKEELEALRLIPAFVDCSSKAIKSASEVEDRAFALEQVSEKIYEFQKQKTGTDRGSNPRVVAAEPPK